MGRGADLDQRDVDNILRIHADTMEARRKKPSSLPQTDWRYCTKYTGKGMTVINQVLNGT